MKIQVLGSGCSNCKKLFELTKKAVEELGIETEVEYINDIQKIIEMGVMSSPVLAIDGKPVITGFVPNIEKIKEILNQNNGCCGDKKSCNIKCSPSETREKICDCGGKC